MPRNTNAEAASTPATYGPRQDSTTALRGGLLGLRVPDEADDPLQGRIGDGAGHADQDAATSIDRAREDGIADPLADRFTLPGQGRLVGPGLAFDDFAIDGEALAGADPDDIVETQCLDRHASFVVVADEAGLARSELDEGVDRPRGPVHRIGFEGAAQREEEEEDGSLDPVAEDRGPERRQDHQQVDAQPQTSELEERRDGRPGAPRDIGDDVQCDRACGRSNHPAGQGRHGAEERLDGGKEWDSFNERDSRDRFARRFPWGDLVRWRLTRGWIRRLYDQDGLEVFDWLDHPTRRAFGAVADVEPRRS